MDDGPFLAGIPKVPLRRRRSRIRKTTECQLGKRHFSDVLITPRLVFSLVPTPLTAAMIAMAIPVAINAYSMAVAPDSSAQNLRIVFMRSLYSLSLKRG
jgi:hypothetical protein